MHRPLRILAPIVALSVVLPVSASMGTVLWTEDAENGLSALVDGTDASYSLIQSDFVSQGEHAFQLANPDFHDNWFDIDQTLTIEADSKLFFTSRLNWATSSQVAKVQLSTNGGASWSTDLFSQPGDGGAGEGAFGLKEIDLSGYSGQPVRFRFLYDFVGGSAFPDTTTNVGWHVDNIQIADQFQKEPYSIGNPSPHQQQYLEYLNRARADALTEADRLAAETDPDILAAYSYYGITEQQIVDQFQWYVDNGVIARHAQPLAFNALLMTTAQLHTQDQFDQKFQGHNSSTNPPAPFLPGYSLSQRVDAIGYAWSDLAENVFSYADSVAQGHAGFDVDWGTSSNPNDPAYNPAFNGQGMQNPAGHRKNIHDDRFKEVGIGVINGSNGPVGPQLVTQDFGNPGDATFVTGVVYEDLNGNQFYDLDEGRGGVRIDVEGSPFYAISSDSGGYTVPVTGDGSYDVSFTGAGFAPHSALAQIVDGANVKIDYLASPIVYAADFDGDLDVDGADLVAWQGAFGINGLADADDDGDSDGIDFLIWQRQFGSGVTSQVLASQSVPEPGALWLLTVGLACLGRGANRGVHPVSSTPGPT